MAELQKLYNLEMMSHVGSLTDEMKHIPQRRFDAGWVAWQAI